MVNGFDFPQIIYFSLTVALSLWALLLLYRWIALNSSFERAFLAVYALDLVRRICFLFMLLGAAFFIAALWKAEWLSAVLFVSGCLLLFAVYRYGDIGTEQLLFSIVMERSGSGSDSADKEDHQTKGTLTDEDRAASALLTLALTLHNQDRFPERIFNRLNRRERQTFYWDSDLKRFKKKEKGKMAGYTLAQLFILTLGFSVLFSSLIHLAQYPERWEAAWSTGLIVISSASVLFLLYAFWKLKASNACFFCGKKAVEFSNLGAFVAKACSQECFEKAKKFWNGMWSSAIKNTVVFGPQMLKLMKEDAVSEVHTSIFQFQGEGVAAASTGELKLRKDFDVSRERVLKMVWEAARQLRLRRVVLLRKSKVKLQAVPKE